MDLYHQYRIYHSIDGQNWELVVDKSDNDKDVPHDYIELREPLKTRYLKIVNEHVPSGTTSLCPDFVFLEMVWEKLPPPLRLKGGTLKSG